MRVQGPESRLRWCRYLMQTESRYICLLGASGHSGMEAGIANLMEPGETILLINQGVWGTKASTIARRYGGELLADKEGGGGGSAPADPAGICAALSTTLSNGKADAGTSW